MKERKDERKKQEHEVWGVSMRQKALAKMGIKKEKGKKEKKKERWGILR